MNDFVQFSENNKSYFKTFRHQCVHSEVHIYLDIHGIRVSNKERNIIKITYSIEQSEKSDNKRSIFM